MICQYPTVSRRTRQPVHTINHDPLPIEPTLRHLLAALQHDVVALEAGVEVVPRGGDEGVLALQILDDLVALGLLYQGGKLVVKL